MKHFKICLFFSISLLLINLPAYGEDPNSSTDGWQFKLMPYAWLPTTLKANKATLSGVEGSLRLNLQEILDNLDMVAYGRVEAWKNTGLS